MRAQRSDQDFIYAPASTISAASRVSASVTRSPATNSLCLPICLQGAGQLHAAAVDHRNLMAIRTISAMAWAQPCSARHSRAPLPPSFTTYLITVPPFPSIHTSGSCSGPPVPRRPSAGCPDNETINRRPSGASSKPISQKFVRTDYWIWGRCRLGVRAPWGSRIKPAHSVFLFPRRYCFPRT